MQKGCKTASAGTTAGGSGDKSGLVAVQHLDDVIAELRVQRAIRRDKRAGEHHFIESRHHRALFEFA